MKTTVLRRLLFLLVVCLLGFLSMGFQMVASRLLQRYFGSSLIPWAYLISTFLAAFSIGSILGGWVSGLDARRHLRGLIVLSAIAAVGFGVCAFGGAQVLAAIDDSIDDQNWALLLSCTSLFVLPVVALSAFSPLGAEHLAAEGVGPGQASGLVYGISTLGNIAGVMVTAFVLIPRFGIPTLLYLWLAVATVEALLLCVLLRKAAPPAA